MFINEEISRDFKLAAMKFFTEKLKIDSKVQLEDGAPNVSADEKVADIFFPKAGIFTLKIKADDTFEFIRELAHEMVHVKQVEDKRLKLINPSIVEFDGKEYPIEGEDFKSEDSDAPFDKEADAMSKDLASSFWNKLNLKEENIIIKEEFIKRSFLKDIVTMEQVIHMTSMDDVRDVADWLKKPANQIIWQLKKVPTNTFEHQVLDMINSYSHFPKDKARTQKILKELQAGGKPKPIFVEANDPTHFILEGRHRIVAFFIMDIPMVDVIFVE
jgi:hypothetical protein